MIGLHRKFLSTLILAFFFFTQAAQPAFSLPDVNSVPSGDVSFNNPDASTLVINASDNSIVNYNSFNIGANESVIINLPNVTSDILNRVIGNQASNILGKLTSNGIVILINQNGIFFGPNSNIDVGSLIASTRDITDQNFLNSKYLFEKLSKDQLDTLLLNQGTINIKEGGFGVLIAGAVKNEGTIIAPMGTIALAAGDMVRLDMSGDGLISVAIDKETASTIFDQDGNPITYQIENTGTLKADGGTVLLKAESAPDIFKAAVNLDGYIQANNVTEKDGIIKIVSSDDVEVKGAMLKAGKIEIGEPGSGKMFLTGSNPQYFYGDGTFYNFTSDVVGKEIYFGAGDTCTFKGTTHIKGAPGYDGLTKLFSTQEGSYWYGDFSQSDNFDVSYVALRDAYNLGDTITLNPGTNWGNSPNWITYHTWVSVNLGTVNWSAPGGWFENAAPTANDGVIFDSRNPATIDNATVDANFQGTVTSFTINGYGRTITLQRDLTVTGSFSMNSGTLNLNGFTLTVGDDFSRTGGTFTVSTSGSTVVFNTAATTTLSGSTTFNNFTSTTASKEFDFTAGTTQTITGTLTLTGSAGSLIKLRSTSDGSQWSIDPQGTRSVSYVDVKDSNNINATAMTHTNSVDSGNNTNWGFVTTATTSTQIETSADRATNNIANTTENAIETIAGISQAEAASEGASENIFLSESEEKEGFNYVIAEEASTYAKPYPSGSYRTVVIVFEGKVVAGPYDEQGLKETEANILTPGQQISQEGKI